jgi:hypothetical protein
MDIYLSTPVEVLRGNVCPLSPTRRTLRSSDVRAFTCIFAASQFENTVVKLRNNFALGISCLIDEVHVYLLKGFHQPIYESHAIRDSYSSYVLVYYLSNSNAIKAKISNLEATLKHVICVLKYHAQGARPYLTKNTLPLLCPCFCRR